MRILGISCYYHDAAATIVEDGTIVAAAQEERFTRKKHDKSFPRNAVRYCLAEAGVGAGGLDAVAFYDKPLLKFHRILESALCAAPSGLRQFLVSVPQWVRDKLWIDPQIHEELARLGVGIPADVYYPEHHESHAASAFYPSPFDEAAILTIDGAGEWATATIGVGEGRDLRLVEDLNFPHSLGLLYSAFTYYCGFTVNSGEYKLMGLAPYGKGEYTDLILRELIDLKDDGSFRLNMEYFAYLDDLVMINERFSRLFGFPPRRPGSAIDRRYMNVARSIQDVTEQIVLRMARHARELTGKRHLCLAGGVALNCVANGNLLRQGIFDDIWIQPAAGDAGGSLGAALLVWHKVLGHARPSGRRRDSMRGGYLGPEFSRDQIKAFLDERELPYTELDDERWAQEVARLVGREQVVGVFRGRMEFGPRALGHRSILGDARSPSMQSVMNLKIKYRESFRPFAPACLAERASAYFDIDRPSPYMLLVADVRQERLLPERGDERDLEIHEWVNRQRSDIPSVTHVDGSARLQTVSADENPWLYPVLQAFERETGCPLMINTSFNVRGEPIVCTPADAYRCFMRTEIDALALGPFILDKSQQPPSKDGDDWRAEFNLD